MVLMATGLAGCRVMTLDEDRQARAQQSDQFDADQYVTSLWAKKILPYLTQSARPLAQVLPASEAAPSKAGGRQAGEGSPWTFVVRGTGTIKSVDQSSRVGLVTLDVQTDAGVKTISLRTGPVVPGTTIRDALPFVTFNDFANQVAFAQVGNALTAQANRSTLPVLSNLHEGDTISFLGVFSQGASEDSVLVTVVEVTKR